MTSDKVADIIAPLVRFRSLFRATMMSESGVVHADEASKSEHSYRDFSQVTLQEEAAIQPLLQMGAEASQSTVAGNFSDRNFPAKLHFVLNELERDGMSDICGWQPHGRCFIVHQQQPFIDLVLRKWFRQTKFASFQRQLNIYGFSRITFGPDKNAYYNEFFLRSKPFLATRIPRLKVKGTGPRRPSSYKSEPNFYAMPFLPMVDNVPRKTAARVQHIAPQVQPEPVHRARLVEESGVGSMNNIAMLLKSAPEQLGVNTPLQAFLQGRRDNMHMMLPGFVPKNPPNPVLTPDTLTEHVLSLSHHRTADVPPVAPPQGGVSQADIARAIYMQSIAARRQSDIALAATTVDPRVYAMAQDLYAQRQRAHMFGGNAGNQFNGQSWIDGAPRR